MLRDAAGDFITGRYDPASLRVASLSPRGADRAMWREMGEMGWLGLGLDEARGGSGLGLAGDTALAELFGRTLFAAPFVAGASMPADLLGQSDTAACRDLSDMLRAGERLVTLAWQEHAGQIAPDEFSTRLVDEKVSGCKKFVPVAEADAILLVPAMHRGALVIVAVAADGPGVVLAQAAAGIGASATVTLDQAPILFGGPLFEGEAAQSALRRTLAAGRIALAAQLAGLAHGCLEKTIAYVGQRVQFNHPIGAFQTIQHRCVDLHIAVRLASASWRHALVQFESAPASAATEAAVSAAKARCGEVAIRVAREAVQMHGAMGFAEEVDIGFYLRSALHLSSLLGGPQAHRRRFVLHAQEKVNHG
ncbi:MAG: acyl-CoA dehydrogenase family protein [Pseudomonadota bacterium]